VTLTRPAIARLALVGFVSALLQLSAISQVAIFGVPADLSPLIVASVGFLAGSVPGAVFGFGFGLFLDTALMQTLGVTSLVLVVVGYLAGRVRPESGRSSLVALTTVAACSFVGTSVYALSGMLLRDPSIPVGEALRVIPEALVYDLLIAPFVLPPVMRLFRRLRPAQVVY
jgi:rod shape-determining protein MreD